MCMHGATCGGMCACFELCAGDVNLHGTVCRVCVCVPGAVCGAYVHAWGCVKSTRMHEWDCGEYVCGVYVPIYILMHTLERGSTEGKVLASSELDSSYTELAPGPGGGWWLESWLLSVPGPFLQSWIAVEGICHITDNLE